MTLRALLLGAFAYVLLLAIFAFGVPLGLTLSQRVNAEIRSEARSQTNFVALLAADQLAPGQHSGLEALAVGAANSLRGRVIVVNPGGIVLADSATPAEFGVSYRSRPEIRAALHGAQVQIERDSKTLGRNILATASPIVHDGRVAGAVRLTESVAAVNQAVTRVQLRLALIGLIVLLAGLIAANFLAGRIGRPLGRLEAVARRVANGDLSARAEVAGSLEQRSLAVSFNEMTDRITRLLSAQRGFVADASHTLRTPLTGLRLRLEEAIAVSTSSEVDAELSAALHEVDRLARTVDELLALSRADQRRPEGTNIEISDALLAAKERWQRAFASAGGSLEVVQEAGPQTIWFGREDLDRALDCLIENALRYSPPRSAVVLACTQSAIEVRDRGHGVAPDERELVFERFHRGSASRKGAAGSGLGLPIARELVRSWDGEVELIPNPGGGTIAAIRFTRSDHGGSTNSGDFARA